MKKSDVQKAVGLKKYLREAFEVGMMVIDSDGNEFRISEMRENDDVFMWDAVSLKNRSGEIEIASVDLQFYNIRNEVK